jgi:primosomal protein N'
MVKYIIEGGINFYEELYKSLDESEDSETDNLCQITGQPLTDKFVTMECNHKFNYIALYTEICKQKFVFQTYKFSSLSELDQIKLKDAKKDYFIKCPYCRNIQFTLLPCYENMVLDKRYGINSLEKTNNDSQFIINPNIGNYNFTSYGYTFTTGNCCKVLGNVDGKDIMCTAKMSSHVTEMNKSFCYHHIRVAVREYKLEKQKNEKDALKKKKADEKDALKKKKADEKDALKKKKEEAKESLKKVKNVVTAQTIDIDTFEPESNATESNATESNATESNTNESNICQTILKSGPRKGQTCGNKALKNGSSCSRHKELVLEPENNN